MPPPQRSLTVCVEALNEEAALRGAVEDLLTSVLPVVSTLEIIVVNDGSTDGTGQVADALAREHPEIVRVIHHARPKGVGAGYREALATARGEYFCDFHGDHENSAEEIARAARHLAPGTAVTTQHVATDPRPWRRRVISRIYTALVNLVTGMRLKYYNGITIYPTAFLRRLPLVADGFLLPAETLVKAAGQGCQIVELELPLKGRVGGRSKALRLRSLIGFARDLGRILRCARQQRRLKTR